MKARAAMRMILTIALVLANLSGVIAESAPIQAKVTPIGLLLLQDDSGANASPDLLKKITHDVRQKLALDFKDILPKIIEPEDPSALKGTEQIIALGKQLSVGHVVRGGLLALAAEKAGDETKITVHLYAEVTSVESGEVRMVRAEGTGSQPAALPELSSIDPAVSEFQTSGLGRALAIAVQQLAAAIHGETFAGSQPVAQTEVQSASPQEDNASAETDEELQQLMAEAESLISSNSVSNTEQLDAVRQSLESLKAALSSKADLMTRGQETVDADQQISDIKDTLKSALAAILEQSSSGNEPVVESAPSGEQKSILGRISDSLGEAFNIIQKIREIRATFENADHENYPEQPDAPGQDAAAEEPVQEVSGVVTEGGEPTEGVTVTDADTGTTTTTASDGSYLMRVPAGKLANLILSKSGKRMAGGQVVVSRLRGAVADFDLKTTSDKATSLRIIPPTVVVTQAKKKSASVGKLIGTIRDPQGRPVARALVALKGLAVARTDSQGRYAFLNVPNGDHQIIVSQSGLKPKVLRARVASQERTESTLQFAQGDRVAPPAEREALISRGSGCVLRGNVSDDHKRPLARAKVTLLRPSGAVAVFTATNGGYEFKDVLPGSYSLVVSKAGYENTAENTSLKRGQSESRDLQLRKRQDSQLLQALQNRGSGPTSSSIQERKSQLIGRVVDAQRKQPIPNAVISIRGQSAVSDRVGAFVIKGLAPCECPISVSKSGYARYLGTVTVRANSSTRVELALSGALSDQRAGPGADLRMGTGHVKGVVTDSSTGRPVAGATVSFSGRSSMVSQRDGGFVLSNLSGGAYQITVTRNGYFALGGTLIVRAAQTTTANLKLKPKPVLAPGIRRPR